MLFVERFFDCIKIQENAESNASHSKNEEKTADQSMAELVLGHVGSCSNEKKCSQCNSANHLTKLSFNDMNLAYVSGTLARFRNLVHLELSHNKIKFVSCQLAELPKLKVLNLSYNELEEIPLGILLIKSLTKLNVRHNLIEYLPSGLLELKNLEVLMWEGNPILSPPLSVCALGLKCIFAALHEQKKKTDVIKDWKPYYSIEKKVTLEPLFKLCVDSILHHRINFNSMETIPPSVKSYLTLTQSSKESLLLPLSKCAKCRQFFTKKHLFLNHSCSRYR